MGDRGNVVLEYVGGGKVWLYTHWSGSKLPEIVASALDRARDRWDDDQYLARVIFCEMVKDDVNGTTGFGISPFQGDGGTEVYVDLTDQTVRFRDESYSFESFLFYKYRWAVG